MKLGEINLYLKCALGLLLGGFHCESCIFYKGCLKTKVLRREKRSKNAMK